MDRYYSLAMNARIILMYQCDTAFKALTNQTRLFSVNGLHRMIFSKLSTVQTIGSVFIKIPKNTVIFCINVQKRIVYFPFSCAKIAFEKVTDVMMQLNLSSRCNSPNVAEMLTGNPNPDIKEILKATREIRAAALNTIAASQSANKKLVRYRKNLEKWTSETDKKIEETLAVNADEKDMVDKLAQTIKFLRTIKTKKAKLGESYYNKVSDIILRERATPEELRDLKIKCKYLSDLTSTMQEGKKSCINALNYSDKRSRSFAKAVLQNEGFRSVTPSIEVDKVLLNNIQYFNGKGVLEKTATQKNFSGSEKLEQIIDGTETIKKAITEFHEEWIRKSNSVIDLDILKSKFEEQKIILKQVEQERNYLKEKLEYLENLIEEQEVFLNNGIERDHNDL